MNPLDPGTDRHPEAGGPSTSGDRSPLVVSHSDTSTFTWVHEKPSVQVAWLPVSACLVITATIGFVVFAVAHWPGGPQVQYVWFYVLLTLALLSASAVIVYTAAGSKEPRDAEQQNAATQRRRTVRVILIGAAVLCCGGSALAWVDVDRTGEVAVEMTIQNMNPKDEPGGPYTVEMTRPPSSDVRDKLRLTLSVSDDDPNGPTCVNKTFATINASTGITPNTLEVAAQSTVDFDLGGLENTVTFKVTLWSKRKGCSMRLTQARGTLHNN